MFRKCLVLIGISAVMALGMAGCGGHATPSVAVTASVTTVDGADTVTLTAVVTNDSNSDGVTWTVSGGGALSNTTVTSATYTAPAATSSAQTVTVTATSVANTSESASVTITVPAKPTVTTTGASLAASVGAAYSVQLAGSGGVAPYTWTVQTATLPPCLSMSTGGLITGTVTAVCAGTYSPVFTMTDSGTPTKLIATVTLSVTIAAAPAITFSGTMPGTGTYNASYTGSAAATGGAGALTYSLAGGSLPTGTSLNASTGAVTGTPTAAGPFSPSIKAADAYGDSNTQGYSIVVGPATPTVTFATIGTHTFGDAAFTASASSASSGAITYSVASGPASIDPNSGLVTLTGAGPVVLGASQAATPNYNAANGSTGFTVSKANATINITTYSVPYDTAAHTATGTATGVGGANLNADLALSGTTHTNAGTYASDGWTFTDATGNYNNTNGTVSDTITKVAATINVTPYSVPYDGTAHTATGTATGLGGANLNADLTLTGTTHTNAGTYASDGWSFTDPNGNYVNTSGTVSDAIAQVAATVNVTQYSVPYDGTAHTATATATGVGGVNLIADVNLSGTTHTNAGTYASDGWSFSDPNGNYTSASGTVTDAISKVTAVINVTPYVLNYDGNSHTAMGTATGVGGANLNADLNLTGTTHTNAGVYATDPWTFTDPNGNYIGANGTVADGISEINATIAVNPYSVTYDGNAHTATATATGANGANLIADMTLSGTTHTNFGNYALDAWSFSDPNHNYLPANGTVNDSISAATPVINISAYSVAYDGNSHTATGSATGVNGVNLSYELNLGGTAHTNAGTYTSDAWFFTDTTGNYSNETGTVSDSIAKASANISVTPYTVTYDGNPHAATGSATGVGGANLASELDLSKTMHTNAGTYNGDPWTFTDTTGNYSSTSGTVNDQINAITPTLTFNSIPTHMYGDASFTASASSASSGQITYSVTSGPASIDPNSGQVTLFSPGATPATVVLGASQAASGNYGTTTATISFTVEPALSIITASPLPTGVASVAYSQSLQATGGAGAGTYTWSLISGSGQLAGLGLNFTGGATGTVSGATPVAGGPVSFTVQVADNGGHSVQMTFQVSIGTALSITTGSLNPLDVGQTPTQVMTAAGGSNNSGDYGWSWTAQGGSSLPPGLNLTPIGTFTGSPTTAGTYNVTVKVTDSGTSTNTSSNFSITIYSALSLPVNPVSLPAGYVGATYTGSVIGSGGSASSNLSITVQSGLPADGLSGSPSGAVLNVGGMPTNPPTTPYSIPFILKLADPVTGGSITQSYSIGITTPTPVSLPTTNPVTLPSATQNQLYNGTINASGGVSPFTWSLNGTPIPNTGTAIAVSNGISVSNNGTNVLTVGGTPTTTTTINLTNLKVVDSLGSNQTNSYSIAVNTLATVSGSIFLNSCNYSGTLPAYQVSLYQGTTLAYGPVSTDGNGNYSFSNVASGSYTITPTLPVASAVFYPANIPITVGSTTVAGENFNANVGYTITGKVTYSGTNTGQTYLYLTNPGCGGGGTPGTSITEATLTSGGAFTIRGVAPGTYTLSGWMDTLGDAQQNSADPTYTSSSGLLTGNVNLAVVPLADPSPLNPPGANPIIINISATDQGVVILFGPVTTTPNGGIEAATSYTLEWSTTTAFTAGTVGTWTFKANGAGGSNVWILNNGVTGGVSPNSFVDGTAYYFRLRAQNSAGSSTGHTYFESGTPNNSVAANATAVTINAPSTGVTVSGAVTIPAGVTIGTTGALYVGFYNQNNGAVYGERIPATSLVTGANNYTVDVPAGSNYFNFAIFDVNNDGIVDAGDVTNVSGNGDKIGVTITAPGPLTGQNVLLSGANSNATLQTQFQQSTNDYSGTPGTYNSYSLNFNIREGIKIPVSVTLTAGPNVVTPVDISECTSCGNAQFLYYTSFSQVTPNLGDTYSFLVTYSDSSTDTETKTACVTGWNTASSCSTGSVVGTADVPTGLTPHGTVTGNTQPTFSWSDPSVDSSDTFSFYLSDNSGNTIWEIPGQSSNSNGFSNSITSLTWGIDPTDSSNDLPGGTSLTTGTTYNWQISVQDSNGNQAQRNMYFIP